MVVKPVAKKQKYIKLRVTLEKKNKMLLDMIDKTLGPSSKFESIFNLIEVEK